MRSNILKNAGKARTGFSMLEITVVLGIVSVSLVGISSLMIQALRAKQSSHYNLVASMLAQEGVELVRNQRDSNWLAAGADWATGTGGNTNVVQDGQYTIDATGTINPAPANLDNDLCRLYYAGGYYTHVSAGAAETPYRRLIEVTNNGTNIDVLSRVRWQDQSGYHYYDISTKLYDWR